MIWNIVLFLKGAKVKKYNKRSKLRKPENLMLINLMNKWNINRKGIFMIGDKDSDKIAAIKSKLFFEFAKRDFYAQIKKIILNFKKIITCLLIIDYYK